MIFIYCENDNCVLCDDSLTSLIINFNNIGNKCIIPNKETEFIPSAKTNNIIEENEITESQQLNTFLKKYDDSINILSTNKDLNFQTK